MHNQQNPSVYQRFIRLVERVRWMSTFSGGYIRAIKTIVQISRDKKATHSVSFDSRKIYFRASDEQALREVLVDEEYSCLTERIRSTECPTILDVGAHIGTFAIWAFHINNKSKILSVEASPATFGILNRNAEEITNEGFDWRLVHKAACANDSATLQLLDEGPSMSHRIDTCGTVDVQGVSLSALFRQLNSKENPIDIVKIDIEGSEEELLCSNPVLLQNARSLVIELHPGLCDVNQVQNVLEKSFDTITPIVARKSNKPLLYCERSCL